MKRQSLKTTLYAFVFTLAIVASFAFKPSPNDVPDDVYIQRGSPLECDLITMSLPYNCSLDNWGANCTISVLGISHDLHSRAWGLICMEAYRLKL
ncbi:hypothetical protein [Flavivirga rizhaonensis]|uniref:Uncharacterized protein n=1 Tax=Flavivirga rizhaonensis TaxID=2559571 RepID=A0A4S1E1U8_9FLAO|nr:hypothetical protein [Flavivirga rizhaonensis]TGV04586.1 hypothetical protein EM932_00210 [Flavivirga rizhaonensis]